MSERGDNAQRLGGGVENGRESSAAVLILLFTQSPGLVLDDVLIDSCDQSPGNFQGFRKLVAVEQLAVVRNDVARDLGNGVVGRSVRGLVRRMRPFTLGIARAQWQI